MKWITFPSQMDWTKLLDVQKWGIPQQKSQDLFSQSSDSVLALLIPDEHCGIPERVTRLDYIGKASEHKEIQLGKPEPEEIRVSPGQRKLSYYPQWLIMESDLKWRAFYQIQGSDMSSLEQWMSHYDCLGLLVFLVNPQTFPLYQTILWEYGQEQERIIQEDAQQADQAEICQKVYSHFSFSQTQQLRFYIKQYYAHQGQLPEQHLKQFISLKKENKQERQKTFQKCLDFFQNQEEQWFVK